MKFIITLTFSWNSVVLWKVNFDLSLFIPLFDILNGLNFSPFIIYFFYLLFLYAAIGITKYKIYKIRQTRGGKGA